jgi:oligopeptidase A
MNAITQTPLLPPARLPLPDFPALTNAGMKTDIEALLAEGFSLLNQANFIHSGAEIDFVLKLDAFENRMHQVWSVFSHLNATCNTHELRETYNALLPELSRYYTELGQNKLIYQAYLSIYERVDFAHLSVARQASIRLALRDFKLSGVALEGSEKIRYAAITERLSQLSSQFSDHLLDATQAFVRPLSEDELVGLPESALALVKQMATLRATSPRTKRCHSCRRNTRCACLYCTINLRRQSRTPRRAVSCIRHAGVGTGNRAQRSSPR